MPLDSPERSRCVAHTSWSSAGTGSWSPGLHTSGMAREVASQSSSQPSMRRWLAVTLMLPALDAAGLATENLQCVKGEAA